MQGNGRFRHRKISSKIVKLEKIEKEVRNVLKGPNIT